MGHSTHPGLTASRRRLAQVAARARPLLDVSAAAAVLGWDRSRTAKQLARWSKQGYLRRIRRGTYAVVPPAAMNQDQVIADPWVLVSATFRRAYVGGWSAAEHWGLTEQVFKTILVCTTDRVRNSQLLVSGAAIRARHVGETWFFASQVEWRDGTRVLVSDVHKTILDLCADPSLGGGIQHVMHCLRAYFRRKDCDAERLLDYARRLGVPAASKRLGFLTEVAKGPQKLLAACASTVTLGLAALDPALPSARVSKRWQLRLPASWERLLKDD